MAEEPLDGNERATFIWLVAQLFFMCEGLFRQYRRGLLADNSWEPLKVTLLGTLQKDLVAVWWNEQAAPISGEFRDYINDALETGEYHSVRPARSIGT